MLLKVSNVCEICRKRKASFTCIKCGKKVCSSCYFNILGLCTSCVSSKVVAEWKGRKKDLRKLLDIEWIE